MGIRFKNRLELYLLFGEKEFPFAPVNSLDFLHMSCSVSLAVPMLHFKVKDVAKWMVKNQVLVDGAVIKIILKVQGSSRTYQFRLNSFKEILDPTGPTYEVDAYYDAITWWLASSADMTRGTSADVIESIATKCNFPNFFKTNTADYQVWIQRNMRYHEYASFIASHGYLNDNSCMQLAFDLSGNLIYKDVTDKRSVSEVFSTAKYQEGSLIATDFKVKNRSGLLNALSGYADEMLAPSVITGGSPDIFKTVPITKLTNKLMVNADIYNNVEKGRVLYAPVDCGNVHANYIKAKYQNARIASTYAFGLELITPQISKVSLLDFIQFVSQQPGEKSDNAFSGTYLVTSRVVYIQGINYYEKIEAVRHGLNAAVNSQM